MGDSRFFWFTSLPKNALDRRCVYCTCKHRPQHLTQFFGAFYFVFFICLYFFLHSSWFTFNLMLIHISKVEDGIFSSPMSKQKQDYSATLFNERMYYSSLRYSVVCFETVLSHRWCNHYTVQVLPVSGAVWCGRQTNYDAAMTKLPVTVPLGRGKGHLNN